MDFGRIVPEACIASSSACNSSRTAGARYRQVLLADAYGGYNGVVAGNEITRAGCWAHLRRKVIEAEKAAPEIAREAIELVRALYVVEKQARDLSVMARLELRQEESAPVLAQLRKKLLEWKEQLLPKHPMAEAVNYALGQWTELNVFPRLSP
jgi:transposase